MYKRVIEEMMTKMDKDAQLIGEFKSKLVVTYNEKQADGLQTLFDELGNELEQEEILNYTSKIDPNYSFGR